MTDFATLYSDMKKFSLFSLLVLVFCFFLSGCSIPFIGGKKLAALHVTSTPKAGIFLDGEHIGSSPYYDEKLKPGEYSIRIVPENNNGTPWEARIKLSSGILTEISRELGDTNDTSSGHVLSLEPALSKEQTSLLVVTNPEGSVITVDGEPRGFAPLALDSISQGDHILLISSPGYTEKSIKAHLVSGYKLTASVQLARSLQPLSSPTATSSGTKTQSNTDKTTSQKSLDENIEDKASSKSAQKTKQIIGADLKPPFVTVADTPTGWLNVREASNSASKIIKKIYPKDSYKWLSETSTGWYNIKLDDGQTGWVSAKYVDLHK